jgi:hypothetical protein
VRITARMWRTLSPTESVGSELVSDTADLLDESRYFAPFIDQLRSVVIGQTRLERKRFWRSMIELAEQNLGDRDTAETRASTG